MHIFMLIWKNKGVTASSLISRLRVALRAIVAVDAHLFIFTQYKRIYTHTQYIYIYVHLCHPTPPQQVQPCKLNTVVRKPQQLSELTKWGFYWTHYSASLYNVCGCGPTFPSHLQHAFVNNPQWWIRYSSEHENHLQPMQKSCDPHNELNQQHH